MQPPPEKYEGLTDVAVVTLPAGDALLVTVPVAVVMSELVVAGSTQLGAGGIVVVDSTVDPHPVRDPGDGAHEVQGVPLGGGQDEPRVGCLLDQLVSFCEKTGQI